MHRCRPASARIRAAVVIDALERRQLLSAAFDVTGLTDVRLDPTFTGVDGSGVGIAVLDTGVYAQHPDLAGNVVAFYNAVSQAVPATIGAGSVTFSIDREGHGTHVAGTAASSNPDIGVAPAADIVSVKVLPDPGEPQIGGDPLLRGLQFVERFADQFNIKVVNMSLGAIGANGGLNMNEVPDPDDISRAIDRLENLGITVVTASGNSYANDPVPGASFPAVSSTISVGSTWSDSGLRHDFSGISGGSASDQFYAFENSAAPDRFSATSQRSTLPNQLVGPGVDIFSTWNRPAAGGLFYNTISGTSMASPFVSGLVALMQDAAFTFGGRYIEDVDDVFDILSRTADVFTDANVADNGRFHVVNGMLDPAPLNLPETGETFRRVNAFGALEGVREFVNQGSVGGPGGDTDSRASTATGLPALTGSRSIVRRGNIGTDGAVDIGPNDVDLFKVTLGVSADISVSLSLPAGGQVFTPSLRLFNAAGQQIGRADAAGGYPGLRTDPAAPLAAGVYYVGVSSLANVAYSVADGSSAANGQSEGDYALAISINNPDLDGVAQGATPIDLTLPDTLAFGSLISNRYEGAVGVDPPRGGAGAALAVSNGDVDMFRVVAPDDGKLQARTLGRSLYGDNAADTYVRVFDANLSELAANDDRAFGDLDSEVEVTVQLGRTYYVAVTNFANRSFDPADPYGRQLNSSTGDEKYNLYLSFQNGDADGTVLQARTHNVGDALSEAIGTDAGAALLGANGGFKDVDFAAFSAPSDGLIDLSAAGAVQPVLGLWEYDPQQNTVVKLADAAGGSARLIAPVQRGRIVYASVTGRGNQNFNWFARASGAGGLTGAYTLNSSMRPAEDLRQLSDGSILANTPGDLTAGVTTFGNLGFDASLVVDADVDLYRFVPGAGGRYDFRTDTSQEGSADTVLRLFDAGGNQTVMNDNASSRTNASAVRVTLVAGQTYYVGVSGAGTGAAAYDPRTGAGAAAGSRGVYALSVTPTTGPAVSVSNAAPVAESFGGASALTFTISLDAPASSTVTVAFGTADGTATAGVDYTATSGTVTFAPGQTTQTVTVPVTPDTVAEGDETVFLDVAVVDGADVAVAADRAAGTIQNQQVLSVGFSQSLKATFTDLDGSPVSVSLKGPGSGQVLLVGEAQRQFVGMTLTGTTAASAVTVKGDTSVGDVTVDGALKSLTGKALDLAGDVTAAGGIGKLQVRSAADGQTISAAAIGSLSARGNFSSDVAVGTLGKMTVFGTLLGADVRAAGSIGSVRAGAASGSRVFAGVRGDLAELPDVLDDFADPGSSIGSFAVGRAPGAFADTLIAAASVGKVVLGSPPTANNGRPFGVAADVLKSLTAGSIRVKNLSAPADSRRDGDLLMRIL